MKKYKTAQGERLLDFFRENPDKSYTVDEISDALCDEGVGKSTVYRRIAGLLESGEIRRFEAPDKRGFTYQFAGLRDTCEEHFHLRCVSCDKLIHVECSELDELRVHISREHGFLIGGSAIINGICNECAAKSEAGHCK